MVKLVTVPGNWACWTIQASTPMLKSPAWSQHLTLPASISASRHWWGHFQTEVPISGQSYPALKHGIARCLPLSTMGLKKEGSAALRCASRHHFQLKCTGMTSIFLNIREETHYPALTMKRRGRGFLYLCYYYFLLSSFAERVGYGHAEGTQTR